MSKIIIIIGSAKDREHADKIVKVLKEFGIETELRIASAHKTPLKVLDIIKEYSGHNPVFITVAGRSNALSGFVDANTAQPVIACPPYTEKFSGADIYSSLRMPSGVCPVTVLEPEQAALAALKMLAVSDDSLKKKIKDFQKKKKEEVEKADGKR
jgi:5-(carboxyamino)imidazole ribonucleotide mutase